MAVVQYAEKERLIQLNIKAINTQRNRYVDPQILEEINNVQLYPVVFSMVHNDKEMRVAFSIGGQIIWVDMDFDDYLELPEISFVESNTETKD